MKSPRLALESTTSKATKSSLALIWVHALLAERVLHVRILHARILHLVWVHRIVHWHGVGISVHACIWIAKHVLLAGQQPKQTNARANRLDTQHDKDQHQGQFPASKVAPWLAARCLCAHLSSSWR